MKKLQQLVVTLPVYIRNYLLLIILCISSNAFAVANKVPIEGKHYLRLPSAVSVEPDIIQLQAEDPDKIQIIEFFSYACYWCWQLRQYMDLWQPQQPAKIALHRYPVVFNKYMNVLGKAYYIAQTLKLLEKTDDKLFSLIHTKRINLANKRILRDFFIDYGVNEGEFNDIYNSFGIDHLISLSNDLGIAYRITETPTIIINTPQGMFKTSIAIAGSEAMVITVLDHLVARYNTPT